MVVHELITCKTYLPVSTSSLNASICYISSPLFLSTSPRVLGKANARKADCEHTVDITTGSQFHEIREMTLGSLLYHSKTSDKQAPMVSETY